MFIFLLLAGLLYLTIVVLLRNWSQICHLVKLNLCNLKPELLFYDIISLLPSRIYPVFTCCKSELCSHIDMHNLFITVKLPHNIEWYEDDFK